MIEFRNVSVIYNKNDDGEKIALSDLSLTIEKGKWCNLLGQNGSGKSTLLKLLAGELTPTSGDIFIDGRSILNDSQAVRARTFFFVEQDTRANLVPSMTIEENLIIAACTSSFPGFTLAKRKNRRDRIQEVLAKVDMGLEHRVGTQVRSLSGGERQALVIAKALLLAAPVLLLDEFLAAMDPQAGPQLLGIVRNLALQEQLTVISVTHNLEHVFSDSQQKDRVVLLRNGKMHADRFIESISIKWLSEQFENVPAGAWGAV